MGLFNKLKNALFEEEEVESPKTEVSKEVKNEVKKEVENKVEEKTPVKEVVKEKKENTFDFNLDLDNERDLFKADNTFNFPDFDEEEFVNSYKKPEQKESTRVSKQSTTPKETYERVRNVSPIGIENNKPTRESRVKKEEVKKKTPEKATPVKTFHPSPVISPVYGILDKNYKKEDIIKAHDKVKNPTATNVDMARKKAFGTLEDDIEMSFNEPVESFYNDNTKSIDDLLNDSIDDTIDVSPNKETEEVVNQIEENVEVTQEEVREEKEVINNEQYLEDNTLESDLFDLIDSMYDAREEE